VSSSWSPRQKLGKANVASTSSVKRSTLRCLSDHVDPPLQLVLQFGDVHLVRDAIGVADALHIAVLIISSRRRTMATRGSSARGDLACANGRAHDGA
jgi:hypothetical protein